MPGCFPQPLQIEGLAEEHLLGKEAVEQRHARHGSSRHHCQHGGVGHVLEKAVYLAHVPAAALVIDDAGCHEQGCLEDGVIDDVEDGGDLAQRCAEAEEQGDQAQVADSGVGQQPLEVVLE